MRPEQFVNPNLHVVLVHYPIALLFAGTLIELFSFLGWRRSGFRTAGRWMILLGVLSGIPTALAGLYALSDVVRMGIPADAAGGNWAETLAVSPLVAAGEPWEMLQRHAWINFAVSGVLALGVTVWLGGTDEFRRKIHIPLLLLLVAGCAGTAASAWYGGEMVYRHGVGVKRVDARTGGAELTVTNRSGGGSTAEAPSTTPTAATTSATVPATKPAVTPAETVATKPAAAAAAATKPIEPAVTEVTKPAAPAANATKPAAAPAEPPVAATPPPAPAPAAPATAEAAAATPPEPATVAATAPSVTPPPATIAAAAAEVSTTQPMGEDPADLTVDAENPPAEEQIEQKDAVEYYFPPLQVHTVMAGVVVALALAAVGLSFRRANTLRAADDRAYEGREDLEQFSAAFGARPAPSPLEPDAPVAPAAPRGRPDLDHALAAAAADERLPVARLWLLASLAAVLTAAGGWWVLLRSFDEPLLESLQTLPATFNDLVLPLQRRLAHVIAAGAIILLPVILAGVARWAPRRRGLMFLLTLLLLAAIAAQVWFGILLMWDLPEGPITGFNPGE